MQFTQTIASAILLFAVTGLTAPVPQLAGEGAALNSIFSSTDNGIGYGVEDAEDNTAKLISGSNSGATGSVSAPPPPPPPASPARRQLAGEGAAANSILSSTDNAIGYGVEDAEDNIAKNVAQVKGAVPAKRQLDKIANGLGAIGSAAGVNTVTDPVVSTGDSVDGTLTSGAADAGAQVGDTEVSTLEAVGSSIPRRQLDKIANGFGAIGTAAGASTATDPVVAVGDSVDGTLTSGAADAGAQVGDTEVSTLEGVGSAVPKQ